MSVNDEQKFNSEEVVVEEIDTTEMEDLNKATRKAKIMKWAKTAGKFAFVIGVGVLGYVIGTKRNCDSNYNGTEIIEAIEDVVTDQI